MRLFSILIILIVILIDFFSKKIIESNIDNSSLILNQYITITKTYNKGIAFSMFDSSSPLTNIFFSIIVFLILLIIINFFIKNFNSFTKSECFAWYMIIGGATANLIDRLLHGHVLDFLIIHYESLYFPAIFNFADSFISLGVFILILNYFRNEHN